VTLHEFPDVIQGSDQWHDQRRGIITASVVGQLITPKTKQIAANDKSRSIVTQLVAERITGYTDPTYIGDDMLRGIEDELKARDLYAEHYRRPVRQVGFMLRHRRHLALGLSPDGLVGEDGLIEMKAPRAKHHLPRSSPTRCPPSTWRNAKPHCSCPAASGSTSSATPAECRCGTSECSPTPPGSKRSPRPPSSSRPTAGAEMVADYLAKTEGLPATERTPDFMEDGRFSGHRP
jgi:hypothetical protein